MCTVLLDHNILKINDIEEAVDDDSPISNFFLKKHIPNDSKDNQIALLENNSNDTNEGRIDILPALKDREDVNGQTFQI